MAFIFPTRTTSSSAQDHLADHNLLASLLDRAGGYTASSTRAQHLAEHNAIHPTFSLPTRALGDSAAVHLSDHTTMHSDVVTTYAGIRGVWGPQSNTANVPGWPGAFDYTTLSTSFADLQTAVNNAGTARKFHIAHSITATAALNPHQGDSFWFDSTVTYSAATSLHGFDDGGSGTPTNVKFMNGTFSGFNNAIRNGVATGWEVAYCDFSGAASQAVYGRASPHIHHNKIHNQAVSIDVRATVQCVVEDNEFYNLTGSEANKIATRYANTVFRHNYCHDITGQMGLWLDTGAVDQEPDNALVEWNHVAGSNYGIVIEADFGGTVVRYNYITGCQYAGLRFNATQGCEAYGNVISGNQVAGIDGPTMAEIVLYLAGSDIGTASRGKVDHNSFHNNDVTVTGAAPRRACAFQISDPTSLITDKTPWTDTNTKLNVWNNNRYHLGSRLVDTNTFNWPNSSGSGVNKSFTQWQAIPQDVNGEAIT